MAKFRGKIGYLGYDSSVPGVYKETIVEKHYRGDTIRYRSQWESGQGINDDISISNQISIVADAYAYQNYQHMRYVVYMGVKWKITAVEVQRPRLILTLGGEYNGEQA